MDLGLYFFTKCGQGERGAKIPEIMRTSFMYNPLSLATCDHACTPHAPRSLPPPLSHAIEPLSPLLRRRKRLFSSLFLYFSDSKSFSRECPLPP